MHNVIVNDHVNHHDADCESFNRGLACIILRIMREVIYLTFFARTLMITRKTVEREAGATATRFAPNIILTVFQSTPCGFHECAPETS